MAFYGSAKVFYDGWSLSFDYKPIFMLNALVVKRISQMPPKNLLEQSFNAKNFIHVCVP